MIKDYEEKDIKPSEEDSTDYMSGWTLLSIKFTELELEFQRIIEEAVKTLYYKENDKMKLKEYLQAKKEKESNAKKRNRKRQSHKRRVIK